MICTTGTQTKTPEELVSYRQSRRNFQDWVASQQPPEQSPPRDDDEEDEEQEEQDDAM